MNTLTPAELDEMYNNRARVPGYAAHFARWAADSAQARQTLRGALDLRYGAGPLATLDVFPAGTGAPVLVFLHGGYWRSLDKSDHSFVAPPFVAAGVCTVVLNYDLCPKVGIADIALQVAQGLAWVWREIAHFGGDRSRIVLAGHSAGGHLAAMLMTCRWPQVAPRLPAQLVRSALSISGLYDLDPIARTPCLQDLDLTPAQAVAVSPASFPAPAQGVFYSVVGAEESAEYLRQNRLIRDAWGARVVPVCEELPGRQHFSALEALVEPGHRLQALALQLLRAA